MSDWSRVDRPVPVPDEWSRPFWEGTRENRLVLQHCRRCGHFQHPPYAVCVHCNAIDLDYLPVRGDGTIYSYTVMHHRGDRRFLPAVPYASLVVELDDAPGVLIVGNLLDAPWTEARVGRRVEMVFQKISDEFTLPQFRLAAED